MYPLNPPLLGPGYNIGSLLLLLTLQYITELSFRLPIKFLFCSDQCLMTKEYESTQCLLIHNKSVLTKPNIPISRAKLLILLLIWYAKATSLPKFYNYSSACQATHCKLYQKVCASSQTAKISPPFSFRGHYIIILY